MKIKTISILSLAVVSLLMSGCAQKTSTTVGSHKVKDLTEAKFNQEFVIGKTTLSQVKERLGKPENKTKSHGFDFYSWTYGTVEGESNGLLAVPYANILLGKSGGKSTQKMLSMGFDENSLLAHKRWHGTKTVDLGFKGLLAQ